MQPEGPVTAAQAEEICRATAHALTLNEAVTGEPGADALCEHIDCCEGGACLHPRNCLGSLPYHRFRD